MFSRYPSVHQWPQHCMYSSSSQQLSIIKMFSKYRRLGLTDKLPSNRDPIEAVLQEYGRINF